MFCPALILRHPREHLGVPLPPLQNMKVTIEDEPLLDLIQLPRISLFLMVGMAQAIRGYRVVGVDAEI